MWEIQKNLFIQIYCVKNDSLGLALLAPADLSSYGEHWNARKIQKACG